MDVDGDRRQGWYQGFWLDNCKDRGSTYGVVRVPVGGADRGFVSHCCRSK